MRRLFSASARRRSAIQGYTSLELGTQLHDATAMGSSIGAGVRLADILELGGGLRYLLLRKGYGSERHNFTGFGYLGGNFTLDAAGWVSLPVGFELGAGKDIGFFSRLKAGLRVNLGKYVSCGLYPFNPTYMAAKGNLAASGFAEWSFPSTFEINFRF